jgi:hypothetical protein
MMERFERLVKWIVFSVVISLLPLAADWANRISQGRSGISEDVLAEVLAHGELLLISAAIAADAVGDLIGSRPEFKMLKYLAGGACLAIILFGSLWYADIAANFRDGLALDHVMIAKWSTWILGLTVFTSGCGKFVAED